MTTEAQSQDHDRDREANDRSSPFRRFVVAALICTGSLVTWAVL